MKNFAVIKAKITCIIRFYIVDNYVNGIYDYCATVKTKQVGGKIMTDERFVYETIRDLRDDLRKSEEQKGMEIDTLIVPCLLKRTYKRLERLQDKINEKSRDFTIELIGDKQVKVQRKKS